MSTTSGPFALTLQTLLTVPDPTAQYGAAASSIQIQNASPFIITCTIDGENFTIQSFTAQTLPTAGSGASLLVLPTTGPAGTQGNLTAIWLQQKESPPMADGQLTGAAQYAQGLGVELYQGADQVAALAIPPTTRTLLVALQATAGGSWPSLLVVGEQSGINYYDQPVYLKAGTNQNYFAVVPVPALIDKNVGIVTTSTATFTMSVFADTAQYDESVFYNGPLTVTSLIGVAGTLLTGPARLLTVAINAAGSDISIAGEEIFAGPGTMTFPPNTILPAGVQLIGAPAANNKDVTYAYP